MHVSRRLPIVIGFSFVVLTGIADATSTTCTTSTVCAESINSSSGVAIHGEANTGIGVRGTSNGSTGFYGASRSGNPLYPGVEGESLDQTGGDIAGGFGLTAASGGSAPAFGVVGYGSVTGIEGVAAGSGNGSKGIPTGFGIAGYDNAGTAGMDTNVSMFGQTTHGTAVLALANATESPAIAYNTNLPEGISAEAEPDKSGGTAVAVQAVSTFTALEAYNPNGAGGYLDIEIPGYDITGRDFDVDNDGNVFAALFITKKGRYVRTTGASGTARVSYSARSTAPVFEDSGEGRLVNGRGYVTFDSALSDVIDKRHAYRVFLTPEGDSNVLYVTQKSPKGFLVCESRGGRSTLSFDYRIIAKPVDDDAQRLALAPTEREPDVEHPHHGSSNSAMTQQQLDPFAHLKSRLGAAEYARERAAAQTIETAP
jgi:hypothetical protein